MNINNNYSAVRSDFQTADPVFLEGSKASSTIIGAINSIPNAHTVDSSNFQHVFQSTQQMREGFTNFLNTIFYQLDEKSVLRTMDKLLADPNMTEEKIYNHLRENVASLKKPFPMLHRLWSLHVLKRGMGKQAAELLSGFDKSKLRDYMEVYDRRYVKTIRKAAKIPLDGAVIALCDSSSVGLGDKLQAGALLSSYPYKQHISLNDANCKNPLLEPEKTHKAVSEEDIPSQSLDMISCLGGAHHIPAERQDAFVESLHHTLRPGGVVLFRDHDVADHAELSRNDLKAMVSLVHTFVNLTDNVSWEVEKKEVREFKSMDEWTELMKKHGFTRISPETLVLKDDPTANGMTAFVRTPETLEELRQAAAYHSDWKRGVNGTRETWIEWGNVRFSKQYAEYIQDHQTYAFDYVGHLKQHWQHFYHYAKESLNDSEGGLAELVFSNDMPMNLFILMTTTAQCMTNTALNVPQKVVAKLWYGDQWKEATNLSAFDKFEREMEKDYSAFIDHTPFYSYNYIGKIKEMASRVWYSPDSWTVKLGDMAKAASNVPGMVLKAAVAAPVRAIFTFEQNLAPDTVKVTIYDPADELDVVIQRWEKEKDPVHDQNKKIELVFATKDGHKLISVPRYRPFTQICGYFSESSSLNLLDVGLNEKISVDILLNQDEKTPQVPMAQVVYEMPKLQDPAHRRYVTYQLYVKALNDFQRTVGKQHIEYIHE